MLGHRQQWEAHFWRVLQRVAAAGIRRQLQEAVERVRQGQEGRHPHVRPRCRGRLTDQVLPGPPVGEVRGPGQGLAGRLPQGPARQHRHLDAEGGGGCDGLGGQRGDAVQEPSAHAGAGPDQHLGPRPELLAEAAAGRGRPHQPEGPHGGAPPQEEVRGEGQRPPGDHAPAGHPADPADAGRSQEDVRVHRRGVVRRPGPLAHEPGLLREVLHGDARMHLRGQGEAAVGGAHGLRACKGLHGPAWCVVRGLGSRLRQVVGQLQGADD
mmetsp:Transcript_55525/g.149734  ORF Transcript_55525/g.149734 Transcript_55525/m.149734 type:complete len:267 (+) Transcript_55525:1630-2430(+)